MKQSIELTKEQFEALLKSAYIGNWMINAHRITPIKKYEDILFHIFSYASKFGLDHFVDSENSTHLDFIPPIPGLFFRHPPLTEVDQMMTLFAIFRLGPDGPVRVSPGVSATPEG